MRASTTSQLQHSTQELTPRNEETTITCLPVSRSYEHLELVVKMTASDSKKTFTIVSDLDRGYEGDTSSVCGHCRQHSCTPDPPPRTEDMMHLITDDCQGLPTTPSLTTSEQNEIETNSEPPEPDGTDTNSDHLQKSSHGHLTVSVSTQTDDNDSSNRETTTFPVDKLSGHTMPCCDNTVLTPDKHHDGNSQLAAFQEQLTYQLTLEGQSLPPRAPKPSASQAVKITTLPCDSSPSLQSQRTPRSPPSSGSRPPPVHLHVTEHLREQSKLLPPRHIRRYPVPSSSTSAGTSNIDEGTDEDVFLRFNESYHTLTRHFQ